jgi:serine/threonine protein kinase
VSTIQLQDGGRLAEGKIYIERPADLRVRDAIAARRHCLVLGQPWSGKTSLGARLLASLAPATLGVWIDIGPGGMASGTSRLLPDLAAELSQQLGATVTGSDGSRSCEADNWARYLGAVAGGTPATEPVVVCLDGFDHILLDPERAVALCAGIAHLARRQAAGALPGLTFLLLASQPVAQLAIDNAGLSPLLEIVHLGDFARDALHGFTPALNAFGRIADSVLQLIFDLVGGHPYLTQRLLVAVTEHGSRLPAATLRMTITAMADRLLALNGDTPDPAVAETQRRFLAENAAAPMAAKLALYERLLEEGDLRFVPQDPTHLELYLSSIAALAYGDGGARLRLRGEAFSRVFGADWVAEVRRRSLSRAAYSPAHTRMRLTIKLLFGPEPPALYGPYFVEDESEELLDGSLFRFAVRSGNTGQRLALQVFRGLGGLGGELWDQERRALSGLSARRHTSFPEVVDSSVNNEHDLAFILTTASGTPLARSPALGRLRRDPHRAQRQFAQLAEALTVLHGNGLMHRNLSLGTIDVIPDPEEIDLRLNGFEMSSLVSNLLRRLTGSVNVEQDRASRRFFRRQGAALLLFCPPERLGMIFDQPQLAGIELPTADVYSLGILGYHLFVGEVADERLAAAFPYDGCDAAALRELHRTLLRDIEVASLPSQLKELLRKSLEWDGRARLTSHEMLEHLTCHYQAIWAYWSASEEPTYLLAYHQRETGEILRSWSILSHDVQTSAGRQELHDLIHSDLKNAALTHAVEGFAPYVRVADDRHRESIYVALGTRFAYFGTLAKLDEHRVEQVLLIRYLIERHRAWRLDQSSLRLRLPPFELQPFDSLDRDSLHTFPSWGPLLAALRAAKRPSWQMETAQALDWLLQLQRTKLAARRYAVQVSGGPGLSSIFTLDPDRDAERLQSDSFLWEFARDLKRRAHPGDFFLRLAEEGEPEIRFRAGAELPTENTFTLEGRFMERLDPVSFRVAWSKAVEPGACGWIEPLQDQASRVQHDHQVRARRRLLEMPGLLDHLNDPISSIGLRGRFAGSGEGLAGGASEVVEEMLASWPFFAVQGPPGTGKTTVTARAVSRALKADPGLRILVSAQSHYALDNLGDVLLGRLEAEGMSEVQALRVASSTTRGKVSGRLKDHLLAEATSKCLLKIREESERRLRQGGDPPGIAALIGDWLKESAKAELELQERIRLGANLVFATTGAATERHLGTGSGHDAFDWVIIEEAAKAWPTELAMPLVFGLRWTLIGDHLQLGAFGSRDVEAFLDQCAASRHDELREHGDRKHTYLRIFSTFASLFAPRTENPGRPRAIRSLDLQFRMPRAIADMVSLAFYDGKLESHEGLAARPPCLSAPGWLAGKHLVWLDTGVSAPEQPLWANRQEAAVVARLVELLQPASPGPPLRDRLVILSPYLAQNRMLRDHLPPELRERVFTVDSFQGREAEIVVVSLVRSNEEITPHGRVGFMVSPERVNVMFSRARSLLIIVGSFDHFARSGVDFWKTVCDSVEAFGERLEVARIRGLADVAQEAL